MVEQPIGNWQTRMIQPRWGRRTILPADVSSALQEALLRREGILEDANYQKVVPNHFIVEVSQDSYNVSYQPIEQRIIQQWAEKLLEYLMTVNSRLGRKEYAFGGRVRIEVQPAPDLSASQVRIHYRVEPKASDGARSTLPAAACLEGVPSGRRFLLRLSMMTIGRAKSCDITLDSAEVAERRLVSGKHAYIRREDDRFWLYDGSPEGRPSINGTYINGARVSTQGTLLNDGDLIVLAAVTPEDPRPDTPGVAAFRFYKECS